MEFNFEQSFGRILGVSYTSMFRHLKKVMKAHNMPITPDQFRVLVHLWKKDGIKQSELAILSNRNRANVTRVIDILERENIVERRDAPNDKRAFQVFLTEFGLSLKEAATICAKETINDALQEISESEIETTLKVLKQIIINTK